MKTGRGAAHAVKAARGQRDHVGATRRRHCACERRLAAAWGAVQEHATGGIEAEASEGPCVLQRPLHALAEPVLDIL